MLKTLFKIFVTLTALACSAAMFLTGLGILRYDGVDGLTRRIESEIGVYRPHPEFVPTPLPTSEAQVQLATPTPTEIPVSVVEAATATPAPVAIHQPAKPAVELTNFTHLWQKWNNCGPATLAMNMSHYGILQDQLEVAAVLKPDPDDKNVSPGEMVAYARSQGFQAREMVGGNPDLARTFLSNDIPLLIETWLEPEPGDGLGHYRLLTGYDDSQQEWIAYDSYVSIGVQPDQKYRGIRLSYDETTELWRVFNGTYVLVYLPEQEALVQSILGQTADPDVMWQESLERAQAESVQNPNDPFAWFNLGSSLVHLGRYEEAAQAYDQARTIGLPWRMLWYQFGPFEAYYEVGRYQEVIALTEATMAVADNIEETYYWKGRALDALGDSAGAQQAYRRMQELNPNFSPG